MSRLWQRSDPIRGVIHHINQRIDELERLNCGSNTWDGDAANELEELLEWLGHPRDGDRSFKHQRIGRSVPGYREIDLGGGVTITIKEDT